MERREHAGAGERPATLWQRRVRLFPGHPEHQRRDERGSCRQREAKTPLKQSLDGFVPAIGLDASVARGVAPPYFRDVRYRGVAMRLYTMSLSSARDGLIRTARPLTEATATISRVRWLLFGLTLGGALVAGLLGRLAAGAVLRPVRSLAGTVREVSATHDLGQRIPASGRDELASLAADFNAMLAALEESRRAQQQLIADASHELRTPLTAHRANIELLARPDLPAGQRQRVLGGSRPLDGEALGTGRRSHSGRPRRQARRRTRVARARRGRGGSRRAGAAPGHGAALRDPARALPARRGPLAARARGRQCSRQRDQVEPARGHRRGPARRWAADRA